MLACITPSCDDDLQYKVACLSTSSTVDILASNHVLAYVKSKNYLKMIDRRLFVWVFSLHGGIMEVLGVRIDANILHFTELPQVFRCHGDDRKGSLHKVQYLSSILDEVENISQKRRTVVQN